MATEDDGTVTMEQLVADLRALVLPTAAGQACMDCGAWAMAVLCDECVERRR